MLFAYAWVILCPRETSYEEFDSFVELALCGDDSLYTVSDEVVGWFNLESITNVWVGLGIMAKVEATGSGPLVERNFLSQSTIKLGECYLPYPDTDKAISSMIWHTRADEHIRWSYLKACALRLSTFWNAELRKTFSEYISFLELNYHEALHSPCSHKGFDIFTYEDVHSVYKTDDELYGLYTTGENRLSSVKDISGLKTVQRILAHHAEESRVSKVEEGEEEEEGQSSCTSGSECWYQGLIFEIPRE